MLIGHFKSIAVMKLSAEVVPLCSFMSRKLPMDTFAKRNLFAPLATYARCC